MENEREIRRGELYWIGMGSSVGSEIMAHRPGVIVSSNKGNETSKLVVVAYTTTKNKYGIINVPIQATGSKSYVLCNQITMVDKSRILGYLGTLSEQEMREVDRGISVALELNSAGEDSEKQYMEEEVANLKEKIASTEDASVRVAVERDMYKRMYEKALEMLVEAKMEETEPKVEEETEPKVEINTCTEVELRSAGCTPTIIHHIIANRPYKSVEDLKTLPRMTRIAFQILRNKICCVPVEKPKPAIPETVVEKVNINTATVEEMETVGISKWIGVYVRAYRNKHGRFEKIEDLLNVERFSNQMFERVRPMLEV